MPIKKLFVHTAAFVLLALPITLLAHGGVDDGHIEAEVSGASALLLAFSPAWWGLLAVASLLTLGLSFGVFKFLHVPPITKPEARDKT